jgi:hypothetical protein
VILNHQNEDENEEKEKNDREKSNQINSLQGEIEDQGRKLDNLELLYADILEKMAENEFDDKSIEENKEDEEF